MFRVGIAPDKAEDADGLAPIKDDNAVWHNSRRNRLTVFMGVQYQHSVSEFSFSACPLSFLSLSFSFHVLCSPSPPPARRRSPPAPVFLRSGSMDTNII